jgi:NTP pyrophosphatase (non-canonical NTP hydrolase)
MDNDQWRLHKLMEECAEVIHRASKQSLFGAMETEPGCDLPNCERLRGEILDVLVCIAMLENEGQIRPIAMDDVYFHHSNIRSKLDAMRARAVECGGLMP